MNRTRIMTLTSAFCTVGVLSGMIATSLKTAAVSKEDVIKDVMKTYHKAPKGVDPVCKKAADGKASPEEIKKVLE